eukprot:jgi/Ulvmu1/3702/UM170_0008.1
MAATPRTGRSWNDSQWSSLAITATAATFAVLTMTQHHPNQPQCQVPDPLPAAQSPEDTLALLAARFGASELQLQQLISTYQLQSALESELQAALDSELQAALESPDVASMTPEASAIGVTSGRIQPTLLPITQALRLFRLTCHPITTLANVASPERFARNPAPTVQCSSAGSVNHVGVTMPSAEHCGTQDDCLAPHPRPSPLCADLAGSTGCLARAPSDASVNRCRSALAEAGDVSLSPALSDRPVAAPLARTRMKAEPIWRRAVAAALGAAGANEPACGTFMISVNGAAAAPAATLCLPAPPLSAAFLPARPLLRRVNSPTPFKRVAQESRSRWVARSSAGRQAPSCSGENGRCSRRSVGSAHAAVTSAAIGGAFMLSS